MTNQEISSDASTAITQSLSPSADSKPAAAPTEKPPVSIMVAIPMYQFMPSYFFFSFMGLLIHITRENKYRLHFTLNDSQPLDKKRNEIVEEALKMKCDYIFWIDSDMGFQADTLDRLMSHAEAGKKVISALNFTKSPPFKPVLKVWNDRAIRDVLIYPENKVIEIDGVGMACCLIATEVYKKMSYPYYRFLLKETKQSNGGIHRLWLAEDLYFCMKAQELGYKIYVDTGLKTRHIGGHGVGEDTYMAYKDGYKHIIKSIDNVGLRMDYTQENTLTKDVAVELMKNGEKPEDPKKCPNP